MAIRPALPGIVIGPPGQLGQPVTSPAWPVVEALTRLSEPPLTDEPAAFQVLRRLAPGQVAGAFQALASLPSLGSGESIPLVVRRPLEAILGRGFEGVRIHRSAVASTLGARAFTSGQQIVFAPGADAPTSAPGFTLLAHEAAHLGQTLGFKLAAGADAASVGPEERAAERQERLVQRIVERGWQAGATMEVLHNAPSIGPSAPVEAPRVEAAIGAGIGSGALNLQRQSPEEIASQSTGTAGLPTGSLTAKPPAGPPAAGAAPTAPNLDRLARQVYDILKAQLRAERDRHHVN
jgi:hypothetical protein